MDNNIIFLMLMGIIVIGVLSLAFGLLFVLGNKKRVDEGREVKQSICGGCSMASSCGQMAISVSQDKNTGLKPTDKKEMSNG